MPPELSKYSFNSLFGIRDAYYLCKRLPRLQIFQLPFRDSSRMRSCQRSPPRSLSTPFSGFADHSCDLLLSIRDNFQLPFRDSYERISENKLIISDAFNSLFGILVQLRVSFICLILSFNSLFGILAPPIITTVTFPFLSTPFSGF